MSFVGIVSGAFKPYSAGHCALIEKAAQENDTVRLFVSESDRTREGEFPIYWEDMEKLWKMFIEKTLPNNVKIYYVSNPTAAMFDMLVAANNNPHNTNYFQLYADENDIKRYDTPKIKEKMLSKLYENKQIELRPLDRSFTQGVSGTQMREALEDGDLDYFVSMLPESMQRKGDMVFKMLGGEIEGENDE